MAIEQKRLCGFRKINGLYLMGKGIAIGCDRLPFPVGVCPTCHQGILPTQGFTWVESSILGDHCENLKEIKKDGKEFIGFSSINKSPCHIIGCEICVPEKTTDKDGNVIPMKYGLIWAGEKFYKTPDKYMEEAQKMGISKRLNGHIPKGLKKGDFVLVAHRKAIKERLLLDHLTTEGKEIEEYEYKPAIFYGFHVTGFEQIVTESQAKDEKLMKSLKERGITPVAVPDDDPDHRGSVYDKKI